MASQIEGAKWIMEHPNFYIKRVTCQPSGKFAADMSPSSYCGATASVAGTSKGLGNDS